METNTEVDISLSALYENSSYQTLKFQGNVKNHLITMVVDSGSTHNFLDVTTAKQLGCLVLPITNHSISVLSGGILPCNSMCPNFTWSIQGT